MRSEPMEKTAAYQQGSLRPARIALALYVVFILTIIAIADIGGTMEMFSFVTQYSWGDKVGHFVLIGLLALLADLATVRRGFPIGVAIVVVLVILEELSQLATTTRTFDLYDLSADFAGITLFVGAGRLVSFVRATMAERGVDPERVR